MSRLERRVLLLAAVAYLALVGAMAIFSGLSRPPEELSLEEQIVFSQDPMALLGFGFATLVPVGMMALLAASIFVAAAAERRILGLVGLAIAAAYAPLSAAAYASQYTAGLWKTGWDWSFLVEPSVPRAIGLLASGLWGSGALFVAAAVIPAGPRWRWGGWTLVASAALSMLAFPLYVVRIPGAELLSSASGVLSLPFAAAAVLEARAAGKGGPAPAPRPPARLGRMAWLVLAGATAVGFIVGLGLDRIAFERGAMRAVQFFKVTTCNGVNRDLDVCIGREVNEVRLRRETVRGSEAGHPEAFVVQGDRLLGVVPLAPDGPPPVVVGFHPDRVDIFDLERRWVGSLNRE
jgi:hypothetical protein